MITVKSHEICKKPLIVEEEHRYILPLSKSLEIYLFIRLMPVLLFIYFFPMPPHVLINFRGFPPGCGDSVADF